MRKNPLLLAMALPLLAAFTLSSCNNKNKKTGGQSTDMTGDTTIVPGIDVTDGGEPLSTEGEIRGGEFLPQTNIQTITFDYDRYELSEDARQVLQANAALLKARKDWAVLVEGHCDDRGTIEYNLALGQKRAKSVRAYYVRLGVPESSIGTISYCEEKPLCGEATDACWLSNRRAETKVKGK